MDFSDLRRPAVPPAAPRARGARVEPPAARPAARDPAHGLRLLVVDGSAAGARVVARAVRTAWPECQVTVARSGAAALRCLLGPGVDLVVLDPAVPPPGGLELVRRVHEASPAPLMVLSDRAGVADKVRALDLGADDYLIKPFDVQELLARLRTLLRRASASPPPGTPASGAFAVGDLTVDRTHHEARLRGATVALTATERRLLEALACCPGTALPLRALFDRLRGPGYAGDAGFLKTVVHRLRRKLGDDGAHPRYVQTVRGAGYRLAAGGAPAAGRGTPASA